MLCLTNGGDILTKNSEPEERLDYHGLSKFLDNLKALFAFKADTPVKLSQLENDVGYKTTDTVYTHPSYAARSTGLYKVSVDGGGHVNSTAEVTKDDITKLGILSETPSFNDAVSTYTTLSDANAAAQTSSDAIKSGVSIFTTLSNMKKTFSAIVQGLKILGTNVGMIQGITSDLNAESDYIAASSKALHTLNSNLALTRGTADKGEKFNLGASYYIWGRMCFVTLESTPSSDVSNGDVVLTGLPLPCTVIYLSLQTAGGDYSARIRRDGTLEIYFPSYKTASRIDTSFCYIT